MKNDLESLLRAFDGWASHQPQSEDGWETSFPEFPSLINEAMKAMKRPGPAEAQDVASIARVWSISEETEDLSEALRSDPAVNTQTLREIARLGDWRARFQVYALAPHIPSLGREFLLSGLNDDSAYVVRRVLLALLDVDRVTARKAAEQFLTSKDELLRRLAHQIVSGESP